MKFEKTLMKCAKIWANESYCKRLKVGAVLASQDGRILATGYNGTLSGFENECEEIGTFDLIDEGDEYDIETRTYIPKDNLECCRVCGGYGEIFEFNNIKKCENCNGKGKIVKVDTFITKKEVLHAEQNIITFCAKNGISTKDTILFVTHSPCEECAKLIIQSGIKEVYYENEYRNRKGIELLKKGGVNVKKIKV